MRNVYRRKFVTLIMLAFLALVPAVTNAWADQISGSSPLAGSTINVSPSIVSITTTSPLQTEGTSIQVTDPNGKQVDDSSITVSNNIVLIGMQQLNISGVYKVSYNLYFQDVAPQIGSYTFTFNSPGSVTNASPNDNATNSNKANGNTTDQNKDLSTDAPTTPDKPGKGGVDAFIWELIGAAVIVAIGLTYYGYRLMEKNRKNKFRRNSARRS